jgi:hypothetical protein
MDTDTFHALMEEDPFLSVPEPRELTLPTKRDRGHVDLAQFDVALLLECGKHGRNQTYVERYKVLLVHL